MEVAFFIFQSPSLRGSGRFAPRRMAEGQGEKLSIPFIAGQWSLRRRRRRCEAPGRRLSIPFIAGQWSLRESMVVESSYPLTFNPLHCGAVVASARSARANARPPQLSIPFIAGQWSLRARSHLLRALRLAAFNPLHCGAVVASC